MWAWKLIKHVWATSSRLRLGIYSVCRPLSVSLQTVCFTWIHMRLRYCNATLAWIRDGGFLFFFLQCVNGTVGRDSFLHTPLAPVLGKWKRNAAWRNSEQSRRHVLIAQAFVCGSLCSDPSFVSPSLLFYPPWSSLALPAALRWSAGVCYRLWPFFFSFFPCCREVNPVDLKPFPFSRDWERFFFSTRTM